MTAETPLAKLRELERRWTKKAERFRYRLGYEGASTWIQDCATELSALLTDLEAAPPQELDLRRGFWINHGCQVAALYGDDGEMQCGACRIDFKRMPLVQLLRELIAAGRLHAGFVPAPGEAAASRPADPTPGTPR